MFASMVALGKVKCMELLGQILPVDFGCSQYIKTYSQTKLCPLYIPTELPLGILVTSKRT